MAFFVFKETILKFGIFHATRHPDDSLKFLFGWEHIPRFILILSNKPTSEQKYIIYTPPN